MMQKVLIVGAGKGGTALLDLLLKTKTMHIEAVIDKNPEGSRAFRRAEKRYRNGTRLDAIHHRTDRHHH